MLRKITPKQMYIRIFLFLGIICTALIAFFSFFVEVMLTNYALKEIDGFAKHRLTQMVTNTEFTLNKLRLYGFRIYEDSNIRSWLTAKEDDPLLQAKVLNSIIGYLSTEPFIHSAYLINFNIRRVIDSRDGMYPINAFQDQRMMEIIEKNPPKATVFFDHATNKGSYLAVIIPSTPAVQKSEGYLVILLDKKVLQTYLLLMNNDSDSYVAILDAEGRQILGNEIDCLDEAVKGAAAEGKYNGSFNLTYDKRQWAVRRAGIEKEGWAIYHLMPLDVMKSGIIKLQRTIILASSMIIIVLLFILYKSSSKNYKPFSELGRQILSAGILKRPGSSGMEAHISEYHIIKTGVETLISKNRQLDGFMKDNSRMVKEEYIKSWILNGALTKPVEKYIRQTSKILNYSHIHLAIVRINDYYSFSKSNDFQSRKLLKFAMGNISQEVLDERGWETESVDFGSDHLLLLLAGREENSSILEDALDHLREQIARWLKISTTIAVSGDKQYNENMHELYESMHNLSMLTFITGEDKVFTEDAIYSCEYPSSAILDEELLKEIIQSVRLGDADSAKSSLDEIFTNMNGLSYEECRLQLTYITYYIMKSFKQQEWGEGLIGADKMLEQFSKLKDVQEWLEGLLAGVMEKYSSKSSARQKKEIIKEMIEYIENHMYDPMLTAEEIADHVELSTNYVRQIFKESLNSSLTEFIMKKRIDYVKELLKTTDWTVAEIAGQSGFQTRSRFFNAFKRETGMTPNQFRQDKSEG